MKITTCTDRALLIPCNLDRFNYQLVTYIGCAHYCYYCYLLRLAEKITHTGRSSEGT